VCGDHIQAIQLTDGQPDWSWDTKLISTSVGFAALSGDKIYVPVEGHVWVLSAADGSELQDLDLSQDLGDQNGISSVFPSGRLLLIATRDKLIAFGPK
jgi:hypothetical protein